VGGVREGTLLEVFNRFRKHCNPILLAASKNMELQVLSMVLIDKCSEMDKGLQALQPDAPVAAWVVDVILWVFVKRNACQHETKGRAMMQPAAAISFADRNSAALLPSYVLHSIYFGAEWSELGLFMKRVQNWFRSTY
jgi:hypothetical protein